MLAVRVYCEMHTGCCTPYWARVSVASEEAKPETGRTGGKTQVIHSVMLEWTTDCIAVQYYDVSKVSILACLLLFRTNHHDNPLTLAARSHTPPFPHSSIPPSLSRSISPHLSLPSSWHNFCMSLMFSPAHGWLMWRYSQGCQTLLRSSCLNICHFQGAKWIQKYFYCSTFLTYRKCWVSTSGCQNLNITWAVLYRPIWSRCHSYNHLQTFFLANASLYPLVLTL